MMKKSDKEIIPWVHPDIGEDEINAVVEAMKSNWIGGNGPLLKEFEKRICEKLNVDFAIAVSSGTTALICAIQALSNLIEPIPITAGIPTFTFIATANAAFVTSDIPVLFDLDTNTWNMEKYIIAMNREKLSKINLLIPVDVGGNPVDYDELKKLELPIIADSAESIGGKYKGEMIGSQANVHCFSLHSAKIITTGEGGLITTNDDDLYRLMQSIANQGYEGKKNPWEYLHKNIGFNYRMTEMQAAMGLIQLKKLDRYVKERIERAKIYRDIIGDKARYQLTTKGCVHPYFLFGILVKNQSEFCAEMYRNNIQVKIAFRPVHKQPCYADVYGDEELRDAEWIAENIVTLPMWNGLNEETTKYVAEIARKLAK